MKVIRAMRADADGLPLVGKTARYLAVRPDGDIPVDRDGFVEPGTEGMSVSPPSVTTLPLLRLPREYGGEGKGPVFVIETDELPGELRYRPDPRNPEGHGFVEPASATPTASCSSSSSAVMKSSKHRLRRE